MKQITQHKLKELLTYEPDTGLFKWKVSRGPRAKVGAIAGWIDRTGYRRITLIVDEGKEKYYLHRLAYLYMENWIPPNVQHIDRDPANNRWANLTAV